MEEENMNLLEDARLTPNSCHCLQKLCYGLGHVYNDLCAAVWFSYTLFYLQIVLQLEPTTAGTLVMLGQVVDAVATPGAGWVVDRIGSHQTWHLAGTLSVGVGFSLIFSVSPGTSSYWWSLVWYGGLIILFQIGWATVQISHLSLIPSIARDHTQSADLTAIRYTASVCCGVTVYLITWAVLKNNQDPNEIGPEDFYKFREIALIITFIGLSSSSLFYCGTRWTARNHYYENVSDGSVNEKPQEHIRVAAVGLLKTPAIYQVSLLYMASRLFTILNQIYIPLYLEERRINLTLDNSDNIRETLAGVPFACSVASFFMSLLLKWRLNCFSDQLVYLFGSVLSLVACLWIAIGVSLHSDLQIYIIACLIGMGSSSTMVSSLCLTADFAKTNGFRGGSVYSVVTFTDKLISGGIVLNTQYMECEDMDLCPHFYRHVLAYVCGGAALLGLITLIFFALKALNVH